jgi:hypothetical protein
MANPRGNEQQTIALIFSLVQKVAESSNKVLGKILFPVVKRFFQCVAAAVAALPQAAWID